MLIDWPTEKSELEKILRTTIDEAIMVRQPILKQAKHLRVQEGSAWIHHDEHGNEVRAPWEGIEATTTVSRDELKRLGAGLTGRALSDLAQQLADQLARGMFSAIQEPNAPVVRFQAGVDDDAESIEEGFLRAIESMEVDFEDGEPRVAVVVSPAMGRRLIEIEMASQASRDSQERVKRLWEQKRDEWIRRESSRRLGD